MMGSLLVTGASGTLGSAVMQTLTSRGIACAGAGRGTAPPEGGSWYRVDLAGGEGLAAAMDGRRAVVHCATNVARPDEDIAALQRIIDLARIGRQHIVYIGIAGIADAARYLAYYRAKQECEKILAGSGVPFSIVRPTQFHDLVDGIFGKLLFGPFFLMPPMKLEPVDVTFAASTIADVALGDAGKLVEVSGPERLEARDMADLWLDARRRQPLRLPLPAVGPLAALASIRPAEGLAGGSTFGQWVARRTAGTS